ncbi:MAG: hypothetical protein JWQ83_1518 [Lacunisphaera sp.]|jgi:hypothetical protein|nr:hypothetical protein [Lacunisphaera sp.]MDB6166378.1 hypothetical protein [Lacunisphaera sp.]
MKNRINKLIWVVVMLSGGSLVTSARAADTDVVSPVKRQEVLDHAKKLLAPRELRAPAADPFHPEAFDEAAPARVPGTAAPTPGTEIVATKPAGPRTDHDILMALATALKAPNVIVLGGQPVLLFGQKRVKAGGTLNINFEGTEYTVEITAIHPPNFTLRLNREEFTRPIK